MGVDGGVKGVGFKGQGAAYSWQLVKSRHEVGFVFKPHTGVGGHMEVAIDHGHAVPKAAIQTAGVGGRFVAAQTERGHHMGGEQMAGMRPKRLGRPPHGLGAFEHGAVFTHAVRQRDVHLQTVLVRAQAAIAQQVGRVVA